MVPFLFLLLALGATGIKWLPKAGVARGGIRESRKETGAGRFGRDVCPGVRQLVARCQCTASCESQNHIWVNWEKKNAKEKLRLSCFVGAQRREPFLGLIELLIAKWLIKT